MPEWLLAGDRRHLEALLHVAMLRPPLGARRLLGSIGWLLPPPQQGLVFRSYRATENSSGGLYVPDLAYGRAPPSDERSFASRRERAACLALPRLPCRSQE